MMNYMRKNVRWIMLTIVVLFVLSGFAMYGPINFGPKTSGGDYAVAQVNGKDVMRSELERGLMELAQQIGNQQIMSEDLPFMRKAVLDNITIASQLAKEAAENKIEVTEEEIKKTIANIENQFPTKEAFQQYIEREGLTEAKLSALLKEQLSQQKLVEEATKGASADIVEMLGFYDSMKNLMFNRPLGYKLNMAVFKDFEQAKKARDETAKGTKWDDMTAKYSADITTATPYDEAVFVSDTDIGDDIAFIKTLPVNEVSKVVAITSDDAVFVIKRSKEAQRVLAFNEVSKDVEEMILSQKKRELQGHYIEGLKTKAEVKILDEALFKPEEPVSADTEPVSGE